MSSAPQPQDARAPYRASWSRSESYLDRGLLAQGYVSRLVDWAEDPAVRLGERAILLGFAARQLDALVARSEPVCAGKADGEPTPIALRAAEEEKAAIELAERQQLAHDALVEALRERGVEVARSHELGRFDRSAAAAHFEREIFPLLTPQTSGPAHPFPVVNSLSSNLLVAFREEADAPLDFARIEIPRAEESPRFVALQRGRILVPIESIVADNLDRVFPDARVESCAGFRLTRHEFDLEPDVGEARPPRCCEPAAAVRLEVSPEMPPAMRAGLASHLGLELGRTFEVGFLGLRDWESTARVLTSAV